MNILVTGAMGFISSNLIPDLLNQGHNVIGFDNLSKPSINPTDRMKLRSKDNWHKFKFYRVDICDLGAMQSILAANDKVDAIIHLAAVGSVPLSFVSPSKTLNSNVVGFSNIIEMTRSFNIQKFIFASSSSVYGASKINPRKEGTEGGALSPYSLSKKMNEELAILLCPFDTQFVGLRFFNVYGPGQSLVGHYSAVIPRFITEENPEVYGDGETTRDFTFVSDVSEAIIKSLFLTRSAILNVGTGQKTSLSTILGLLGKLDQAVYKDSRHGDVTESYADVSMAQKVLNFTARFDIIQGLELTKSFYDDYVKEKLENNAEH